MENRSFLSSDENVWADFGSGTGNHVGVLAEETPYSKFQHSSVALFLGVGTIYISKTFEELQTSVITTQLTDNQKNVCQPISCVGEG